MFQFIRSRGEARGVFRIQSSVWHGAFAKIVNGSRPLSTFAESSFLDVWLGSGYARFFVHPWCDRIPGFASPNKLLQKLNKSKKNYTSKVIYLQVKDLNKCKLSYSVIENGHLHTLLCLLSISHRASRNLIQIQPFFRKFFRKYFCRNINIYKC